MTNVNISDSVSCLSEDYINHRITVAYLIEGSLYLFPYVPCAVVIWRVLRHKNSCYVLMASMAAIDITAIVWGCFLTGVISCFGLPLCIPSNVYIAKFIGAVAFGCWTSYCGLCISLGINRLVSVYDKPRAERWFSKTSTSYWVKGSLAYGSTVSLCCMQPWWSCMYDSRIGLMSFVPHKLSNPLLSICAVNNFMIAAIITVIYFFVYRKLHKMSKMASKEARANRIDQKERAVTLQSLVLCSITSIAAYAYVIVPMVTDATIPLTICSVLWSAAHGMNAIVYLTLNKTIRQNVISMFRAASIRVQLRDDNSASTSMRTLVTSNSLMAADIVNCESSALHESPNEKFAQDDHDDVIQSKC